MYSTACRLSRVRRSVVAAMVATACAVASLSAAAGSQVPAAVASLRPPSAALDSGDWGVFEHEFGKTFTGGMRAEFPGRPSSCDMTIGPELRVELKGDTAWEEPPMLDMAVQIFEQEIERARTALPARVANLAKTNGGVQSVGTLGEELPPNGLIFSIAYTENCARHPNGPNTVLLGFARKGATQFYIDLWISTGADEAKAMAADMLERFQKLDIPALTR